MLLKNIEFLEKHFGDIMDYKFTAKMEEDLDEVAEGKKNKLLVIKPFYEYIKLKIENIPQEAFEYEKPERNEMGVRDRIESRSFRKGELLNEVRNSGLTWAKYADIKTGKKNFLNDFNALVEKQTELKEEFEKKKEEAAAAQMAGANKPTGVNPLEELAKKGKVIETTDEEGNVIVKDRSNQTVLTYHYSPNTSRWVSVSRLAPGQYTAQTSNGGGFTFYKRP